MSGGGGDWPAIALNSPPTARATARHGLKARKTSPKATLRPTKPSQTVTNANVTEKLRSGASVPLSPVHTVTPSKKTPIRPQMTSIPRFSSALEIAGRTGRQRVSSNLIVCHATVSATNETIRTSEAPHANSHSGIGRSWRPTSAWPAISKGASNIGSVSWG